MDADMRAATSVPPPTTLAAALDLPTAFERTAAIYSLAAGADEATLQSLVDEAAAIGNEKERRAAMSILYSRYADLDPTAALAQLDTMPGDQPEQRLEIFRAWAEADPDAVIAAVHDMDDWMMQQFAMDAILLAYEDADEGTLERFEARLPGLEGRSRYSPRAIEDLSGDTPNGP